MMEKKLLQKRTRARVTSTKDPRFVASMGRGASRIWHGTLFAGSHSHQEELADFRKTATLFLQSAIDFSKIIQHCLPDTAM